MGSEPVTGVGISRFASKSEDVAESLFKGTEVLAGYVRQSGARQAVSDTTVVVGSTEVSRQIVNGLRQLPEPSPFRGFQALQLPLLQRATSFVDTVTGSARLLANYANEYRAGSKLYPKTLLSSISSVLQIFSSVAAAKTAAGLSAAAATAVLGAIGVGASTTAMLAGGTAIAVGAATAYGVGKAFSMIHRAVDKLM